MKKKVSVLGIFMFFTAFMFTACSDSSEDEGDTTPPTVISVSPLDGAVDVDHDAVIVITFSEELAENGGITLSSAEGDFGLEATINGSIYTLTPSDQLRPNTEFTVTASGLADTAQNTMADYSFSFTTDPIVVGGRTIFYTADDNLAELTTLPVITPTELSAGDSITVTVNVDSDTGCVIVKPDYHGDPIWTSAYISGVTVEPSGGSVDVVLPIISSIPEGYYSVSVTTYMDEACSSGGTGSGNLTFSTDEDTGMFWDGGPQQSTRNYLGPNFHVTGAGTAGTSAGDPIDVPLSTSTNGWTLGGGTTYYETAVTAGNAVYVSYGFIIGINNMLEVTSTCGASGAFGSCISIASGTTLPFNMFAGVQSSYNLYVTEFPQGSDTVPLDIGVNKTVQGAVAYGSDNHYKATLVADTTYDIDVFRITGLSINLYSFGESPFTADATEDEETNVTAATLKFNPSSSSADLYFKLSSPAANKNGSAYWINVQEEILLSEGTDSVPIDITADTTTDGYTAGNSYYETTVSSGTHTITISDASSWVRFFVYTNSSYSGDFICESGDFAASEIQADGTVTDRSCTVDVAGTELYYRIGGKATYKILVE